MHIRLLTFDVILCILRFSAATISALSATKSAAKRYLAASTSVRLYVIWVSAIRAIRRQPLNAGKLNSIVNNYTIFFK